LGLQIAFLLLNPHSPGRGQLVHAVRQPPDIIMSVDAADSVPTRQSLLIRLKQWDDSAGWRDFFDTYWELIYNVGRKAGLNDAEAQDVVQETVLAVARKIGEFKTDPSRGSFKSWLLGQARWRIADQFRARKRAAQAFEEPPAPMGKALKIDLDDTSGTQPLHRIADHADNGLEGMWNAEWEQHVLRTALERVKAQVGVKQFQMFDLHANKGLTVAEAAHALGTTKAAVYMAKSRVGRLLKREVRKLVD
jgi:RNA polymerase sigma-70 factor (ECF subfamily)